MTKVQHEEAIDKRQIRLGFVREISLEVSGGANPTLEKNELPMIQSSTTTDIKLLTLVENLNI